MARWEHARQRLLTGKRRLEIIGPRRAVIHICACTADSLYNWYQNNTVPYTHFQLSSRATWEQYRDTALQAPGQLEGNPDCVSTETYGTSGPFSDDQQEELAQWLAWLNSEHGIPLRLLPSSRAGLWGIGWHRLGVDGNFPSLPDICAGRLQRGGGQRWSTSRGKLCPLCVRIRQIPGIVKRAIEIVKGDMPSSNEVADAVWSRLFPHPWDQSSDPNTWPAATFLRYAFGNAREANRGQDKLEAKLDAVLAASEGLDTGAILERIDQHAVELRAGQEALEGVLGGVQRLLIEFDSGQLDADAVVARIGELLSQAS